MPAGELYIVATPIGNVGDISRRACEVLAAVDLVIAEDSRHSGRLLQRLGIGARLRAYHDFSGPQERDGILRLLAEGKQLALICDAGTPLIADPGYRLVQAARAGGYSVIPVPGPSAFLAALSVAGLPTDRFAFEGFLPEKAAARRRRLESLKDETRTMVFYEAPHRLQAALSDMQNVMGGARGLFLGRELSKKFEEHYQGSIADSLPWLAADSTRQQGEFVLVLAGAPESSKADQALQQALTMAPILAKALNDSASSASKIANAKQAASTNQPANAPSLKHLATLLSHLTGARKNPLYRALLQSKQDNSDHSNP